MVTGKGGKVLIVEDDPGIAALERRSLERKGYQVLNVATTEEALEKLRPGDIELMVLDYRLPGNLTGLDFYTQIKASGHDLPVILVTAFSEEATVVQALRAGVRDFVTKSLEYLAYLPEAVERVLRQERIEKQLVESQVSMGRLASQLHLLLESTGEGIYGIDDKGLCVFANRAAAQMFGYTPAELIGKNMHVLLHHTRADGSPYPREQCPIYQVSQTGQGCRVDSEVMWRRDGASLPVEYSCSPILEEGAIRGAVVTTLDITERKRAEEALKDSAAVYRSLVESLPLTIFRKDLEGRLTFGNTRFLEGLGKNLEDIIGKTSFDFNPTAVAEKFCAEDRKVIETGQCYEIIQERGGSFGERTYHHILKAPVYDARGRIVGTQGMVWDITASKLAEEELRRIASEAQVARLIQQKLYPTSAPQAVSFDIGGASYPAQATGGDYFDFFPLLDQAMAIVVGDVSGHGFGPALLMAETRAYLRALAKTEVDITQILTLTNQVLSEDTGGDYFVTLFFGRLDPRDRTFSYASAGHPSGYILDSAGAVRMELPSTGLPVGIMPDGDFPCNHPETLQPGDLLLVLTDGVVEAADPSGNQFGVDRALDIVRIYRAESARQIVDNLYHAVRAFTQNLNQVDDITAVVVKVEPASP